MQVPVWQLLLLLATFVSSREYRGLSIGRLSNFAHGIAGEVFVVNMNTLFIEGFSYDGTGPDAYFWVGTNTREPDSAGTLVPYPNDGGDPGRVLRLHKHEDVVLHLPPGINAVDLKWLSVWCRLYTVNFGHALFSSRINPPEPITVGPLSELAHGVRSGDIVIVDTKTLFIPKLYYDGGGPDAYFWVGNTSSPSSQGVKIPNESGSLDVLRAYSGKDVTITLPGEMTVHDIRWLSVWCVAYRHNFGSVIFPQQLSNLPPHISQLTSAGGRHSSTGGSQLTNCMSFLEGKLQARWGSEQQFAYVELSAALDEKQWYSFGISGDQARAKMIGADVAVGYFDASTNRFMVDDYYLASKSQCSRGESGGNGVCKDGAFSGTDDVELLNGRKSDGVTSILFRRRLLTEGSSDKDITLERPMRVIVAMGSLNERNQANYHDLGWDTSLVDFSAVNQDSCGDLSGKPAIDNDFVQPWDKRIVADTERFEARIGPTGGSRGYESVTGYKSWGIAWWINGLLVPELYVRRGRTYTFVVEGGDDPTNPAEFHPLYITDSPVGGYHSRTAESKNAGERVFAGVRWDATGGAEPTAVGRLCQYEHRGGDQKNNVTTFEHYRSTLQLQCAVGKPALLKWTVQLDAPDIVYYQCYTHRNLGWKIHVLSESDEMANFIDNGGASVSRYVVSVEVLIGIALFARFAA